MIHSNFQFQIERLINTFGKGKFHDERIALIWDDVNTLDDVWFAKLVDGFLKTMHQAPLPIDFEMAARDARSRRGLASKMPEIHELNLPITCLECSDSGIRFSENNYVSRCSCSAGKARKERW
jgi:hypothetical protein